MIIVLLVVIVDGDNVDADGNLALLWRPQRRLLVGPGEGGFVLELLKLFLRHVRDETRVFGGIGLLCEAGAAPRLLPRCSLLVELGKACQVQKPQAPAKDIP